MPEVLLLTSPLGSIDVTHEDRSLLTVEAVLLDECS